MIIERTKEGSIVCREERGTVKDCGTVSRRRPTGENCTGMELTGATKCCDNESIMIDNHTLIRSRTGAGCWRREEGAYDEQSLLRASQGPFRAQRLLSTTVQGGDLEQKLVSGVVGRAFCIEALSHARQQPFVTIM